MSITTPLQAADNGSTSRTVLNDNFTAVEVAIEAVVNDGAPLATTSVAGRSRLSAAPVDATIPIAVGTNDTRMNVGAGMTADEKAALAGGGAFGTPSGSNKFLTEQFSVAPQVVTFTSSGTWTKDTGLKYIIVECQAAGGKGSSCAGGAGGGYNKKLILASALSATEAVTVGTASLGSGNTSLGSLLVAGNGGNALNDTVGVAGAATGGDVNIPGQVGGGGYGSQGGGHGGSSFMGNGAGFTPPGSSTTTRGGRAGSGFGAGGSGNADASDGTPSASGDGGAGTAGIVIVTEFY